MSDATESNTENGYLNLRPRLFDSNPTMAKGTITNGSLYHGLNLTDRSGPPQCGGYYHEPGLTDPVDSDDWGTMRMLEAIEIVSYAWSITYTAPRVHSGDISRKDGGRFYNGADTARTDHTQHQKGIEVDIRYVRKGGAEGSLNLVTQYAQWDSVKTLVLIGAFLNLPDIHKVIVDPIVGLAPSAVVVVDADDPEIPGDDRDHKDHFHVWLKDPDGEGN